MVCICFIIWKILCIMAVFFFFDDLVIRAPVDLAGRLVQLELWKVQII